MSLDLFPMWVFLPFIVIFVLIVVSVVLGAVRGNRRPTSLVPPSTTTPTPGFQPYAAPGVPGRPVPPAAEPTVAQRLAELEALHTRGLVTDAEYEATRARILGAL